MPHTYTEVAEGIVVCNDCGAHADRKENILHHSKCVPGDAERWEKFYEEASEKEET